MKLLYVLLSSTFGMHQYTSHYANHFAMPQSPVPSLQSPVSNLQSPVSNPQSPVSSLQSPVPSLLTSTHYPKSRYAPTIPVHTPVSSTNSGMEPYTLNAPAFRRVVRTILEIEPDLVHFTGPHLWNVLLLRVLRRHNIPTVHTIHDLDPHHGASYGRLLHLWNGLVIRYANVILLHGKRYHQRLLQRGIPAHRLAYTPLLHLFLGHETQSKLESGQSPVNQSPVNQSPVNQSPVNRSPVSQADEISPSLQSPLNFLFFGRLLPYKGLDDLLDAWALLQNGQAEPRSAAHCTLTIAGPGELPSQPQATAVAHLQTCKPAHLQTCKPAHLQTCTPANLHTHNTLIDDQTALQLFRATDLVLLPYHDATQSALVAAAYYFKKPVLVTRTGALPEYVEHHETGYVVNARDPRAIAAALSHAMQNPDHLRQMGQNGHAWYRAQRAREEETMQTLYHSLLNHNHHPP